MKELFTEVLAGMVKHPGAHNSGIESLAPGPEGAREGALLRNLAEVVPWGCRPPNGSCAFQWRNIVTVKITVL